jgi:hypothetical protein
MTNKAVFLRTITARPKMVNLYQVVRSFGDVGYSPEPRWRTTRDFFVCYAYHLLESWTTNLAQITPA